MPIQKQTKKEEFDEQVWMLFRVEHNFVYYLWNGTYCIIVSVPNGIDPAAYYWVDKDNHVASLQEREILNAFAHPKNRKKIMEMPSRKGQRYVIESRGVFHVM